jgi:hypothetical protein
MHPQDRGLKGAFGLMIVEGVNMLLSTHPLGSQVGDIPKWSTKNLLVILTIHDPLKYGEI